LAGARSRDHGARGPGRRAARGLAAAALLAALPGLAGGVELADDAATEITGRQVRYEADRRLYEARGDVRIRRGARRIEADWILYSAATGRGLAAGDVRWIDGPDELRARLVEFDLRRETGWIHEAALDLGPAGLRIRAREMERRADRRWWLAGGAFTACRCPDPEARDPWRVRAGEALVDVGGYAEARNARLEILNVPVLWFPWMLFPVKTERESGLLVPRIGLGDRTGFEVSQPVFWAAHPQVGLLLTPRHATELGPRAELALEAVYGERAAVDVAGTYGRDTSGEPVPDDRWHVRSAQRHELPGGVTARIDGHAVSDNAAPLDYPELRNLRDARTAELAAAVWRHAGDDGRLGAWGRAGWADDLQRSDRFDRDDVLLQRWPELRAAWLEGPLPGPAGALSLAVDAELVHFDARESALGGSGAAEASRSADGRFLDLGVDGIDAGLPGNVVGRGEGNGRFDEGELLADRGQRLLVHPRLAWPGHLGALRVRPEIGWRQALASSERAGFAERGLLTARAEVSLPLARRFEGGLDHGLEPYLDWVWVHGPAADDEPLFVPPAAREATRLRARHFDLWSRDPGDGIARAHRLGVGLRQQLGSARGGRRRHRVELDAVATWDLAAGRAGPAVLRLETARWRGVAVRSWAELDAHAGEVDDAAAELRWRPFDTARWRVPARLELRGGYRFLRDVPPFLEAFDAGDDLAAGLPDTTQVEGGASVRWGPLRLGYDLAAAPADGGLLRQAGFVDYLSRCGCWSAGVELRDDRVQGLQGFLRLALTGIGTPAPPLRSGLGL